MHASVQHSGLGRAGTSPACIQGQACNMQLTQPHVAACCRDGQTKPCHVYRMLTTGTIEEKVSGAEWNGAEWRAAVHISYGRGRCSAPVRDLPSPLPTLVCPFPTYTRLLPPLSAPACPPCLPCLSFARCTSASS